MQFRLFGRNQMSRLISIRRSKLHDYDNPFQYESFDLGQMARTAWLHNLTNFYCRQSRSNVKHVDSSIYNSKWNSYMVIKYVNTKVNTRKTTKNSLELNIYILSFRYNLYNKTHKLTKWKQFFLIMCVLFDIGI
jgi:hypothetical protein